MTGRKEGFTSTAERDRQRRLLDLCCKAGGAATITANRDQQPEDRCTLSADCDAPFETTIVGWAGGTGWVFDACWPCAKRTVDVMSGWAA